MSIKSPSWNEEDLVVTCVERFSFDPPKTKILNFAFSFVCLMIFDYSIFSRTNHNTMPQHKNSLKKLSENLKKLSLNNFINEL